MRSRARTLAFEKTPVDDPGSTRSLSAVVTCLEGSDACSGRVGGARELSASPPHRRSVKEPIRVPPSRVTWTSGDAWPPVTRTLDPQPSGLVVQGLLHRPTEGVAPSCTEEPHSVV